MRQRLSELWAYILSIFINIPVEVKPEVQKVWVNPTLTGRPGEFLPLGSRTFDVKGRLCEVTKQGNLGALKKLSKKDTMRVMIQEAVEKGPSLKLRLMMLGIHLRVLWSRFKKGLHGVRKHLSSPFSWAHRGITIFWVLILPLWVVEVVL